MERKKTWFSYLLWLIYAGLTGVLLASFLSVWCVRFGGSGKFQIAATVGLGFVLLAGIWFFVSWFTAGIRRQLEQDRHLADMLEWFLALSLYAGVLLYWIYSVLRSFVLTSAGSLEADGLIVQGITLPMFYLALRWMAGRPEALCAAALLVLSPEYVQTVVSHTAEGYYFSGCVVCLFLVGMKRQWGILYQKGKRVFCLLTALVSLLSGVWIGILGYYHLTGWCLLVPAVGSAAESRTRDRIRNLFLTVVGAAAGIAVPAWGDALRTGRSIREIVMIWQGQNCRLLPGGAMLPEMGDSLVMNTVVIACAALVAIGFWFCNTRKQDAWILLLFLFLATEVLGLGCLGQDLLLASAWSICAGIGAASVFRRDDWGGEIEKVIEIEREAGGSLSLQEEREPERSCMEETPAACRVPINAEPEVQLAANGVRLLENPLPLPKKHVSRTLDYEREPEEWEMGYDLPVHEDDDFDF